MKGAAHLIGALGRLNTEAWQRNLYVVAGAELVAISGFTIVTPFLPYYVRELGVTDLHEIELWSGAVFAAHAIAMAVFAPIWGSVADRYGPKLMIERAMFGAAVVLALMGFAQNVWQLTLLRAAQGALSGTVTAAMTLVASSTPREKCGYALGLLQTAVGIGAAVGPLFGGLLADTWGYRFAFWVTGGLLFLAGGIVWRSVREQQPVFTELKTFGGFWKGLKLVVCSRPLLSLFLVGLFIRLATRILNPVLPLVVQGIAPSTARVASLTGLISGVSAATMAIGAVTLGRASDRIGYRRVLLPCATIAAFLHIPQFVVSNASQLLVLQAVVGLVIGGALASLSALLASFAPKDRQGAVYGVDASVLSIANAMGPLLSAGMAATLGLRTPFLLAAGGFALAAALGWVLVPRRYTPVSLG